MQIRNVHDRMLEIADTGQRVDPGEVVEVDDVLGVSLCEQPERWAAVKTSKTKAAVSGEED
jgi:hypothetical protein